MMMMMMMFSVSRLLVSYPHNHGNDDLLFPLWLTVVYSTLNPYAFFAFSANFRNAAKQSFGKFRILLALTSVI